MEKWTRNIKRICLIIPIICSTSSFAINLLPGSAQPGRVQENYLPTNLPPSGAATPKVAVSEEKPSELEEQAKKIKFVLKKVILQGNKVYSKDELSKIYQDKLNKEITLADLLKMVEEITNFYRNNGYIISQAILPPQQIENGIVRVQIVEGYIDQVKIIGSPKGARPLIQAYGNKIAVLRPLNIQVMEHYLYLANMIPGAEVKAVLEPSKTKVGAADLNLASQLQLMNVALSYDNYGTLYLGPQQVTTTVGINSIFIPGDVTRFIYLSGTHDKELRFGDLSYSFPVGTNGLQLTLDGNQSITYPGFVLKPLETAGRAETYTISLQYPIILAADQNLSVSASLAYLNATSSQLGFLLYDDRIRPLQIGLSYTLNDPYKGFNAINFSVMHGFDIWNASNEPDSLLNSKFKADGIFTKLNLQVSRSQGLFDRFSAFALVQGQYTFNPLLVEEQFGFGGSFLGRGYDPAEILGDQGLGGTIELRMDTYPDIALLNTAQFYGFYDVGKVWNINTFFDFPQNQSIASTGFGVRFAMLNFVQGNVMITQPLTKDVSAEEILGRGKSPRLFFSVVAAL